jgi:metal-responsive CopG/Arc/MetJ family transcriptional regulator
MQVQITTSLSKNLVEEMDSFAKLHGKKKNQIIEESVTLFLQKEKKNRFVESFKKASLDKEIVDMADEGLGDYEVQLKKLKI